MTEMSLEQLRADPRVTVRRDGRPDSDGKVVVYWMQRAQRAIDNPALDVAINAANALQRPVVVFLAPVPFYPHGNLRHYQFLFDGFPELESALAKRRVNLIFRHHPDHRLVPFCEEIRASLVVGDENPLRETRRWRNAVAKELRVPFWTVDADVIVPSRLLEKEQYAARTLRPRINKQLGDFLPHRSEPIARVAWEQPGNLACRPPSSVIPDDFPISRSVKPVPSARGGTTEGLATLRRFITDRLSGYGTGRNHPECAATSELSPFLHFGHLGPRMIARAVLDAHEAPQSDRDALVEQLIVRRELAVNFVFYNDNYDRLESCEPWALRTLADHRNDQRHPEYTPQQFENAETHDPLWNAAQQQMTESGWMHGYVRMYWAKKILQWSASPEDAFAIAIDLNDRYELDGRDPNGYAGVAWAIGGKHDRAWGPERPIFGKIRYMSYKSTGRKFDSSLYVQQWQTKTP